MPIYLGENRVSLSSPDAGFLQGGYLVAKKTYSFNLSQTNFSSITPTTSAQNLTLPATDYSAAGTTITCLRVGENDGIVVDRSTGDYTFYCEVKINHSYGNNDISSINHGIRYVSAQEIQYTAYRNTFDAQTGILKADRVVTTGTHVTSKTILLYQKANNEYVIYGGNSGIYGTASADFGTTNGITYINLKCTTFKVQGNATYFPVDSFSYIDPSQTTIDVTWYIYKGGHNSYGNMLERCNELVSNPRIEEEE